MGAYWLLLMVDYTLLWSYKIQLVDAEDAFRIQFSLFIMLLFLFLFHLSMEIRLLGHLADLLRGEAISRCQGVQTLCRRVVSYESGRIVEDGE